jgi:4-aminobutyrate aminotransferase
MGIALPYCSPIPVFRNTTMYSALRKGLSFKVTMANIITLTPPLTITMVEMSTALDILKACFAEL